MAIHADRIWNIKTYPDATPTQLVIDLLKMSWTLCSGFRWRNVLLVNDSFTEDSLQEYALCVGEGERVTQVDSLTISWMAQDKLVSMIEEFAAGAKGHPSYGELVIKPHPEDGCELCF